MRQISLNHVQVPEAVMQDNGARRQAVNGDGEHVYVVLMGMGMDTMLMVAEEERKIVMTEMLIYTQEQMSFVMVE